MSDRRLQRLEEVAPYLVICVLPLLILAIDSSFLCNRLGDVDTWFYYGHMTSLGRYRFVEAFLGPYNYYQTRLPFIVPGWLLFTAFPQLIARTLHFYLYYVTVALSLFYVLKQNTTRASALVTTLLLGTDIYFLRTTGWDYVDLGVLCYVALAFVALTAATNQNPYNRAWVVFAGFCFASAVFTHLMSAICAIPLAAYAFYRFRLEQLSWRAFGGLLLQALAGIAACQVVYGLMNVLIWRTPFFFLRAQFLIAQREITGPTEWEPLGRLFAEGTWLDVPIGVCLACIGLVLAAVLRVVRLNRFQLFCFATTAVFYLLCYGLDQFRVSEMMARQGLYAGFLAFFSYFAIGAMLDGISIGAGAIVALILALASLLVRLKLPEFVAPLPAWAIGALLALALLAIRAVRTPPAKAAGLVVFAAVSLLTTWRFERDESVYAAHDAIARIAGSELPRFVIDEKDPLYHFSLASIVAAFTERALWLQHFFPTATNLVDAPLIQKAFVVVATSQLSFDDARQLLAVRFAEVKPREQLHYDGARGPYSLFAFDVVLRHDAKQ